MAAAYDPQQVTVVDLVNWNAFHAFAVYYRDWLASVDATDCSLPLMFSALFATVAATYIAEKLRIRTQRQPLALDSTGPGEVGGGDHDGSNDSADVDGDHAADDREQPHSGVTGGFRQWCRLPFLAVILFAFVGWTMEGFGEVQSSASRICAVATASGDAVAQERCLNETAE